MSAPGGCPCVQGGRVPPVTGGTWSPSPRFCLPDLGFCRSPALAWRMSGMCLEWSTPPFTVASWGLQRSRGLSQAQRDPGRSRVRAGPLDSWPGEDCHIEHRTLLRISAR